ncbi:hypothetical protein RUM44_010201 [Polyplax serrata]|uniref:Uncharacterized protein n=1 Tax=Polyplax serrata TaxID=468196 RepID=A0ABR1AWM8_POLSC
MEKNIYGPVDIIRSVTSGHVWPPPTITTWSRDSLTFHRDIMRRREELEQESWRLAWTHSNDFFFCQMSSTNQEGKDEEADDGTRPGRHSGSTTRHDTTPPKSGVVQSGFSGRRLKPTQEAT